MVPRALAAAAVEARGGMNGTECPVPFGQRLDAPFRSVLLTDISVSRFPCGKKGTRARRSPPCTLSLQPPPRRIDQDAEPSFKVLEADI